MKNIAQNLYNTSPLLVSGLADVKRSYLPSDVTVLPAVDCFEGDSMTIVDEPVILHFSVVVGLDVAELAIPMLSITVNGLQAAIEATSKHLGRQVNYEGICSISRDGEGLYVALIECGSSAM